MLPSFESYDKGGSQSQNCLVFTAGKVTVWFSYQTPVAFQVVGYPKIVHQNDWGTTTGKHLNMIDGGAKEKRVDSETFSKLWDEQTKCLLS